MIAAVRCNDALRPFGRQQPTSLGGWCEVTIRCECGFRLSAVNTPRLVFSRLNTCCPKCGTALEPPISAKRLDALIDAAAWAQANDMLRDIGERMDQIRQVIAPICPHCSKPLLDSEITSAVRALIQILQTPEGK